MPSAPQKAVVISYTFPPMAGIGGRRWVKFSKYLHKQGVDIKVFAARNRAKDTSLWIKDLEDIQDRVTYLESGRPRFFGFHVESLFEKLMFRFARRYARWRIPGNYYDRSAFWIERLLQHVEQEIQNGYHNIIVTGAPFIHAYHLCSLKEKYPHINYIVDFRDPWVGNKTAFGFDGLSKERQDFEIQAELKVVETADRIISVAQDMTEYFSDLIGEPADSDKFITLRNGFDREDLPQNLDAQVPKDHIRFVFTGTVYEKAQELFESWIAALDELKGKEPEAYSLLRFDFYGPVPAYFPDLTAKHPCITLHGNISLQEVYQQIAASHLSMLFLTDDITYSLSTKFCEYIASGKPIAVFSKPGKTGQFVEENRIGYALEPGHIADKLLQIVTDHQNDALHTTGHFDLSDYDVANLTKQIIRLLR